MDAIQNDRVWNESSTERIGVEGYVIQDIEKNQLIWYGHGSKTFDPRKTCKNDNGIAVTKKKRSQQHGK